MNAVSRKRTAVFEVDLSAMIGARTTAPLGVRAARAAVHNLESNWIRVAGFSDSIIGPIGLCLYQLNALAAGQVVIEGSWQRGPELGVVIAVWSCEVATKGSAGRVFAKQGIRCTKSVTRRAKHGIRPAGCNTALCAETVQAKATGPAAR